MKRILLAAFAVFFIAPAYGANLVPLTVKQEDGSYALKVPTYCNRHDVAANTAESDTVPSVNSVKATYVFFAATAACQDFYVNYTTTAIVPAGDVTDGTAPDHNPTVRFILGTSTISIISPNACSITLCYTTRP